MLTAILLPEELTAANRIWAANQAAYELLDEARRFAASALDSHVPADPRAVVVTGLFFRVLQASGSVGYLSLLGHDADAGAVQRSALEALFTLANCAGDESFAERYVKASELDRLKLHRAMRQSPPNKHLSADAVYRKLSNRVEQDELAKLPSVEQQARDAGADEAYLFLYRYLSNDVHVSPWSLNRYMRTNDDGELEALNLYPERTEAARLAGAMAVILIAALEQWAKVLGKPIAGMAAMLRRVGVISEAP